VGSRGVAQQRTDDANPNRFAQERRGTKARIPTTTNNTLEPQLQISIPQCPYDCSASPEPRTSVPPPRHNTSSTPPDLHASTSPRPHACSAPPEIQISIPPYFLFSTPTACLRSSRALKANTYTALRRQRASRAPGPLRQIPPHLHACSVSPDLRTSLHLYVPGPAACPQSS